MNKRVIKMGFVESANEIPSILSQSVVRGLVYSVPANPYYHCPDGRMAWMDALKFPRLTFRLNIFT